MKFSQEELWKFIRTYAMITLGVVLYCFAYTAVVIPADLVSGGMSGVALLIYYATGGLAGGGIPVGYSIFISNALLLAVAFYIIGGRFGAKTIYAIILMSVVMNLMQGLIPRELLGLGEDKLLSAILAGAMSAAGISIVLAEGGSTGGTDIVAMIINKYRNISYGRVIILCDGLILGSSIFIFKDISIVIYGYVMVAVFGYTVDMIIAGNKQSSQIFIISQKYDLIAQRISQEVHRGVTLLDGEGWYTKERKRMVMVVCRKNETQVLFRIIRECDPMAFITVGSVMGVYGLGFETLKK